MRKIYSFKDGAPYSPNTIKDPTDTNAQVDLGHFNGLRYVSYDDENVVLHEQPLDIGMKFYDLDDKEDADHLASIAFEFEVSRRFRDEQRDTVVGEGFYTLIKRSLEDSAALTAEIDAVEAKIEAKLVELGLKK